LPPRRSLIVLAELVAAVYAVRILQSGTLQALDTATYSRWADLLIAMNFNLASYVHEQSFVAPPLTYLLWVLVVAVLKSVLGASWMTGVVVLNWIALAAGAYATIAMVRKTTMSSAGMLLAAVLFVAAAELLIFVPYVLSDLMFWGLSTAVLACGISLAALGDEERGRFVRLAIAGSILVVIALLFRPVAIPLLLFWLLSLMVWPARGVFARLPVAILAIIAGLAAVAIAAHAYVLSHPQAWPFGTLPQILAMVADEARQGMFVHNANPPMFVAPAVDGVGLVRITLQKMLFFITPWLPHYSTAHTLMNVVFFLTAYGLSMAAVANLRRLTPPQQRSVCLLAAFVMMLTVFHALLLIDSDHRYRLPMLPALIMLAAIGLESVRRPQRLASTGRAR
jgi:hypothetical protein